MPDGFGRLMVVGTGACGCPVCSLARRVGSGLGSPVCACFLDLPIPMGLSSVHVLCPVVLIVCFLSWAWAGCSECAHRLPYSFQWGSPVCKHHSTVLVQDLSRQRSSMCGCISVGVCSCTLSPNCLSHLVSVLNLFSGKVRKWTWVA